MIVYKITNTVTNHSYIGATTQPLRCRLAQHRYWKKRRHLTALQKAIREYGWGAFAVEVLAVVSSRDELDQIERHYIRECRTLFPHGYNRETGGAHGSPIGVVREQIARSRAGQQNFLGRRHSAETRLKMSESQKASGYVHPTGWRHTEESKKKISEAMRRRCD